MKSPSGGKKFATITRYDYDAAMFIKGVGTATPPWRYTQRECWEAVCRSDCKERLSSRSLAILKKVLCGENGIETRYFAMRSLEEAFSLDPNTLHRRFADNAPVLAAEAARRALAQAGKEPREIDSLLISTCTGYVCPGLTSYVSEQLGLRNDIFLADLVGQGCGAALPNLRAASAILKAGEADTTLSICVEICSAAFYLDNDPGVLVSACLFGDGAAAVVCGREPGLVGPKLRVERFASVLNVRDRDLLRFESRDGMLRNVLDKSVPLLVVEQLKGVMDQLFATEKSEKEEISTWLLHAGGRDVLAALRTGLNLSEEDLRFSAEVLRQYGNLSSPSVFFALERALSERAKPGKWFMTAFGAGISAHGAILKAS